MVDGVLGINIYQNKRTGEFEGTWYYKGQGRASGGLEPSPNVSDFATELARRRTLSPEIRKDLYSLVVRSKPPKRGILCTLWQGRLIEVSRFRMERLANQIYGMVGKVEDIQVI